MFGGQIVDTLFGNMSKNGGHVINIVMSHKVVQKSRNMLRIAHSEIWNLLTQRNVKNDLWCKGQLFAYQIVNKLCGNEQERRIC